MLQLKNLKKEYLTGDLLQTALDGVSLNLRDNEFVAILGPSGSGKTTLLNIIGGLDHYDSGDMIINGISTKQYKDRDWDSYRNHTIGFVFQSYNLIPHQSVLSNVELALTISGVSAAERKKLAKDALKKVGLGDQIHKKPNQMSGGQMQRVAIARALVNNPDILLADEPTGALDSETSIQVMNLLKEVAKDRLVVMVTHNPELAEKYATRIVNLRDGKIISDSNTLDALPISNSTIVQHKNMGKASMSFWTSIRLSFTNLKTKKGRTILTAFAGSIGIIGIALILSLSTGVNNYIDDIQKDTMTSYPITIQSESLSLGGIMGSDHFMSDDEEAPSHENEDRIFADNTGLSSNAISTGKTKNNLTDFKHYLDDPDSEINNHLGENGVIYTYDVHFDVFSKNTEGKYINTNLEVEDSQSSSSHMMSELSASSNNNAENFSEILPGTGDNVVSQVFTDSYDVVYGCWPSNYNDVVLVLDENNSINTTSLYQLGFLSKDKFDSIKEQLADDSDAEIPAWDYDELCAHSFNLIPACDYYIANADNTYKYIGDDAIYTDALIDKSIQLSIVGVIRPKKDVESDLLSTPVAYSSKLTNYIIDYTNSSTIVTAQEASPNVNVLNGMPFSANDTASKISNVTDYLHKLSISDKASLFTLIMYNTKQDTTLQGKSLDEASLAASLDAWLNSNPDEEIMLALYDEYLGETSYDGNMSSFGKVSYDTPYSISLYADNFEDKDSIADCITDYNKGVSKDAEITYVDYIALITSSITSIVNVITYVLIAFVAVSLIVSCIMIGIITHISVLERTKEIGILRAIGASKRNISQVFNAETLIIGLFSGLLGILIAKLLTFPINAIIHKVIGSSDVNAVLPILYALALVGISIVITMLGGFLPSKKAAKKDPVVALRSE